MSIKIIAAVGKNNELGKKGDLCFHIKEDMKFFRETTTGYKVLMGKRTWESMNSRPLKNRENYVATFDANEKFDGAIAVNEPEKFFEKFQKDEETLFAIGGASIYKMAVPYADEIILTEIDAEDKDADVFFPEFDKTKFERTVIGKGKENDLAYSFVSYKRK